jgi:hypothetical protein
VLEVLDLDSNAQTLYSLNELSYPPLVGAA